MIGVWINGWVNNREAGDLRRYRANNDVTVMRGRKLPETGTYVEIVWETTISESPVLVSAILGGP